MLDNCRPSRASRLVEENRVGKVMLMSRISKYAVADVEDCKGRRRRGRGGKVDGLPEEEERKEGRKEGGGEGTLAREVQWYNRAFDTQQTCGGAMQSSVKRVRDGQGSK